MAMRFHKITRMNHFEIVQSSDDALPFVASASRIDVTHDVAAFAVTSRFIRSLVRDVDYDGRTIAYNQQ